MIKLKVGKSKDVITLFVSKALCFLVFAISIVFVEIKTYAVTLIDYNKYSK